MPRDHSSLNDEIDELSDWRRDHELHHATKEAILYGDGHAPGQLDRIETSINNHSAGDDKHHAEVMRRLTKVEKIQWKILAASGLGATVAIILWRLAEHLNLVNQVKP